MRINTLPIAIFIAVIATIVFTFFAYKYIIPEKNRKNLNKLGQFLHDAFNFNFLIIEKVIQFFYVLATIACVCGGVSMVLAFYISKYYTAWYGIYGILAAILGPIAIRLVYEGMMLGLLLVKNVMQINKKLKSLEDSYEYQMPSLKELTAKENFDFIKNLKRKQNSSDSDIPTQG